MTLTEFLLARIAEDEAVAHAAQHQDQPTWRADFHSMDAMGPKFSVLGSSGQFRSSDVVDHVVRFQPSRVLAECEAKRALINEYGKVQAAIAQGDGTEWTMGGQAARGQALMILALPYSAHPDYRPGWAPNLT